MNKKIEEKIKRLKEKIAAAREKDVKAIFQKKLDDITGNRKSAVIAVVALVLIVLALPFAVSKIIKEIHMYEGKLIKVSGNIEGTEVRLSFRVEAQITELLTDEGMVIKVGDVIARLDKATFISDKARAEAALKEAEHQHKLAYDDMKRANNLYIEGSISDQERDGANTRSESTKAKVDLLRAELELADLNLGYTDLISPLNAFVLTKSAEAGEVVHIGATVFTAIDLSDIWLTAYVIERDLGKVKLNQKAYVVVDSFPRKKYNGWISFISQEAEFTPKYVQTNTERVKLVYRIKVRVDNRSLELKPGMPGDGFIITD